MLATGRTILLDGGTGSELRRRGLALSADCWSAAVNPDHGELLCAIHRDYIAAGADLITANTFAGARFVLAAAGLDDRFDTVNRTAIRAARAAIDAAPLASAATDPSALQRPAERAALLAASLSCMPPGFDRRAYPSPEREYRDYCELVECFAAETVDVVLLEMLQHPPHAERACRAVESVGLPWLAGLSMRQMSGPTGTGLFAFDDPAQAIEDVLDTVLRFSPAAIAIMHTPLDTMRPALDWLRRRWDGPVAAYPEIPYPEDPEYRSDAGQAAADRVAPADYAREARRWQESGARLIGGCCGTTPAHIAALHEFASA